MFLQFAVAAFFSYVCVASHSSQWNSQWDQTWTEDVVSYSGYQLWSATPRNKEEREFLSKIAQNYDLDVWKESRSNNNSMDLLISPHFQTELILRLADAEIPYNVTISDVQKAIDNEKSSATNNSGKRIHRLGHKMDWNSYHSLGDIYDYLKYLVKTYPDLVQLINIGSSYERRALYVVRISSVSAETKPAIWIDGGIHAREWISPAVATYIIRQLVEEPANSNLLSHVDWYIMPVINPDGYEFTHVQNRLWRKTRSKTPWSLCRGVDANRNFGFKWGGLGAGKKVCSEIFRGTKPFSESETFAVSKFIEGKSDRIKIFLTLHSYGQNILIPWGYGVAFPPDYDEMLALAKSVANKFVRFKYTVGNSALLLYPAAGCSHDWAKSIGIKYSYTVELPDTGTHGFVLPTSFIQPVCEDFFPALEVFVAKISPIKV